MSLSIALLTVSDFQQNCRVVFDPKTKRAIVVDPGGEAEKVISFLKKNELQLEGVYLTHSHIDHCGAVAPLLEALPVPLYGHAAERMFRENVTTVAQMYGIPSGAYFNCPEPDLYLDDGMEIDILGVKTKILSTPGHSPGSISLWMPSEGIVFSGDVIFLDSIGRTDLPGGQHDTLLASIGKLMDLIPLETKVLSGHGQDTTIGREKEKNPFLKSKL